jgi:hypothetical protein
LELVNGQPPLSQPQYIPPRQGMGCFAKGCLTVLILGFLCLAAVVGSCWYIYHQLATNNLISDAPADLLLEQPSDTQYRAAEDALARVKSAKEADREETVAFTAADLNALLAKDPDFEDLKGHVRVDIRNSAMTINVSAPLKMLQMSSMRGRWFNGILRFRGGYESGVFRVTVESARGGDYEVPGFIISSLNTSINESLNENTGDWQKDAGGSEFWRHVKSLKIEGDKVVVTTQAD